MLSNSIISPPVDPVLSKRSVAEWLGVHPSTIDRWMAAGLFPAKTQLGPMKVGWRRSQIEAWLAQR